LISLESKKISIPRVGSSNLSERAKPVFTKLHSPFPPSPRRGDKPYKIGTSRIAGSRRPSLVVADHQPSECPFNCPSIWVRISLVQTARSATQGREFEFPMEHRIERPEITAKNYLSAAPANTPVVTTFI
jgi:hypothetical protein